MELPDRPLVVWDGTCAFCRAWVARWRSITGERVDYAPYQELGERFAELPREELRRAVHLIEPDGRITRGAEAAFRALARADGHGAWLALYRGLPPFRRASEWAYRRIAGHRDLAFRVTRAIWGAHLVPPGERLTAWIFQRLLGLIFAVAFVSLWVQVDGLIGERGILPVRDLLQFAHAQLGPGRYWTFPTLCWLGAGDGALHALCAAGVACSALATLGLVPVAALFGCWACYLSLSVVGQEFFWFQWDTLLLETGSLALLLAPWRWRSWPGSDPAPSRAALWLQRWLLFRLMFSSAVVKLASGDPSWRQLTALRFHYETQCLPPWTAWFAHQLPAELQRLSAIGMFAIEGAVPFLVFAPRRVRFVGAGAIAVLQALIMATGNYGFFNGLALALCLLWLDDGVWPAWARRALERNERASAATPVPGRWPPAVVRPAVVALVLLSLVPVVRAFRRPSPWLAPLAAIHRVFAPFRSVNPYGLFAVMTTRRMEIVVEGSDDGADWRDYEFAYKPGDPSRRPRFVAPHQPRLDWQMWFAALGDYRSEPWFLSFCRRLLEGSPAVTALLAENPFPRAPPRFLRASFYEYRFTDPATRRASGAWWRRTYDRPYCPVLTLVDGELRAVELARRAP